MPQHVVAVGLGLGHLCLHTSALPVKIRSAAPASLLPAVAVTGLAATFLTLPLWVPLRLWRAPPSLKDPVRVWRGEVPFGASQYIFADTALAMAVYGHVGLRQ